MTRTKQIKIEEEKHVFVSPSWLSCKYISFDFSTVFQSPGSQRTKVSANRLSLLLSTWHAIKHNINQQWKEGTNCTTRCNCQECHGYCYFYFQLSSLVIKKVPLRRLPGHRFPRSWRPRSSPARGSRAGLPSRGAPSGPGPLSSSP